MVAPNRLHPESSFGSGRFEENRRLGCVKAHGKLCWNAWGDALPDARLHVVQTAKLCGQKKEEIAYSAIIKENMPASVLVLAIMRHSGQLRQMPSILGFPVATGGSSPNDDC